MIRRSKYKGVTERWGMDPNKTVSYEFTFGKHVVKPGTQVKIKNDRGTYTFLCLVHNTKLDTTWLELTGPEGFKSVRIERISGIVGLKRSYKKKVAATV